MQTRAASTDETRTERRSSAAEERECRRTNETRARSRVACFCACLWKLLRRGLQQQQQHDELLLVLSKF